MIVPSIDLQGGRTVQLVGGRDLALEAGDPVPLAARFGRVGEIAVIDLDAALGTGDNAALIAQLLNIARCRVGGGIRSVEQARRWLDAGAERIIIGTAATPGLLCQLPPERVIVALDARDGEVVVEGWTRGTGRGVTERMAELRGLCGGFLVTFVEREGRMVGLDAGLARDLVAAAAPARLTVAGGVRSAAEVAVLDAAGCDVQVGMALYTGVLDLADAFVAPLAARLPEGPWPTVVCDEHGIALGLAWSDTASVREALATGRGVYHSRRRGLWVKGLDSGCTQDLLGLDLDCDRDALRAVVRQHGGGFCHTGARTCWGEDHGAPRLARRLAERMVASPPGSYTRRLLDDPALLAEKLQEEAMELATARSPDHVAAEAADVIYFALVALARAGGRWEDVGRHLDHRERKVTRRRGDAKVRNNAGREGNS
ncbi:MAG: phosphoribosyl-ATP diphosphatase [bacterium]|nr:phosphoribosyl-ATP diphosphatase [bacterium]